ncbi:MAG: Holliday junction branch migration DNA helicase RuvB, partial [Clostridia bacterium]|nr:Holliday junction branch migration DNA helicase RuvB [Clostridia bacterium]
MSEERIISAKNISEDGNFEVTLRPRTLEEYVGQENAKESLEIFIKAAKLRNEP